MSVFQTAWLRNPRLPALKLAGARVVLQPPRMRDWGDWADVRARNYAALQPFEPTWPPDCLSPGFFKRRLRRQQADWQADLARYFLIRLQEDGALIGGININNMTLGAARHGSLGYWLDQDYRGQGYMQESIKCVLSYAFEAMALQRVHAACIPDNDKSMNVLRRCGFVQEGFARAYMQINGQWRDHYLFGITKDAYACPESADKIEGSIPSAA